MPRKKKEYHPPGDEDMHTHEAFFRVLTLAMTAKDKDERDKQAIELISAVAVGRYGVDWEKRFGYE